MATKKPPTQKTIDKYNIQFDNQNRVIIPEDLRRPDLKVQVAPKVMKASESVEYLINNYKPNGLPPKTDIIKKYKQFPGIIGLVGDTENIIPTLEQPEKILEALREKYTNLETLKQKWQVLFTHVSNVPMELDKKIIHEYEIIFNKLKNKSKEATTDRNKDEKVYRWDKILDGVEKTFGKNSMENFFFRMFDEIPIRNEFGHPIPIVHQLNEAPQESNFVLDRGGHMVEFHLREWKTKGTKYPDEIIYKFSPALCDIFRRTEQPRSFLLPVENWTSWVQETLNKSGFPKFPYGTEDSPLKDIASGLRKTIATFRNSSLNEDRVRGADLAYLMLHDHSTSVTTYRHLKMME